MHERPNALVARLRQPFLVRSRADDASAETHENAPDARPARSSFRPDAMGD